MAYCSLENIKGVLAYVEIARLTDDSLGHFVNSEIVNNAIARADDLIDGYLRSRYSLPLSSVPKLITNISVDLAIYFLYQRRFRTDMPEPMEQQYKSQIKTLEQIQKGFINLGIEIVSTETAQTGGARVNKTSTDRYFNDTLMQNF